MGQSVECLLCRQPQVWPSYRGHLACRHLVMKPETQDFILQVSRQKQAVPVVAPELKHTHCQTLEKGDRCAQCGKDRFNQESHQVWVCPLCPRIYTTFRYMELHLINSHGPTELEEEDTTFVLLPHREFLERKRRSDFHKMFSKERPAKGNLSEAKTAPEFKDDEMISEAGSPSLEKPGLLSGVKRKSAGEKWEPLAFSSSFPCQFCGDKFGQDFNLKLHLHTAHPEQSDEQVQEAKGQVSSMKLEGCVHQCEVCGNKFTVAQSFRRHIKDHHGLDTKQYREQYGDSEIVTNYFTCRLCDKSVKQTRNLIVQHLSQVHRLSWKEYLEGAMQQGTEAALPKQQLFHCKLCGSAVSLGRQHLIKQHRMEEEVYRAIYQPLGEGQEQGEIVTCGLCDRDCLALGKHLRQCHGSMGRKEYRQQVHLRTDIPLEPSPWLCCPLPQCRDSFTRDHRLLLHVRWRHGDRTVEELAAAWAEAERKISSCKRSSLSLTCGICGYVLASRSAFWTHVTRRHGTAWEEYLETHGDPGSEGGDWKCGLCGIQVKHDQSRVRHHLKTGHQLGWEQYQQKMGELGQGTPPGTRELGQGTPPGTRELGQGTPPATRLHQAYNLQAHNLKRRGQTSRRKEGDEEETPDRKPGDILGDLEVEVKQERSLDGIKVEPC